MTELGCVQAYEPSGLKEQPDPANFSFAALYCRFAAAQPVDSWTGVSAQELPLLWLLTYFKVSSVWEAYPAGSGMYLKGVRSSSHEPVKCSKQSWQQQYQNPISHCFTFVVSIGCLCFNMITWNILDVLYPSFI